MTPTPTATAAPTEADLTPDLIDRVFRLSRENRRELGEMLLDSAIPPPEPPDLPPGGWKEEIARRIAACDRGEMKVYSLEEASEYIRGRLREKFGDEN